MGLGPRGESLLARLDRPTAPFTEIWMMEMEQQERNEVRSAARVKFFGRKKPGKALAPVEEINKIVVSSKKRVWLWVGEDIPSKDLMKGEHYTSEKIRACGFKLPKLKGGKSGSKN